MTSRAEIQAFVNDVVRRFHPEQVILFGSHATGTVHADSDVDLLVIMHHRGPSTKVATRIRLACPRSFPMDLLVRSPAELRRRISIGDPFFKEVMDRGLLLYENNHARVGR